MAELGISDLLSIAQTIRIVGTMSLGSISGCIPVPVSFTVTRA